MNEQSAAFSSRWAYWRRVYSKPLSLALTMGAGILVPQAHVLAGLMPYLLMAMLFLSFIDMRIGRRSFDRGVFLVLLANLLIAVLAFLLLHPVDPDLALVAFITGITPTATAAPVIISFLEGRVEYVVASVLLTNTFMALAIPFLLPLVVGTHTAISTWDVLQPVLLVVFVPLGLARLFVYLPKRTQAVVRKGKPLSFYLWLANLFLVSSKAASFLFSDVSVSTTVLINIALVSLVICVVNFGVGALLGGRDLRQESSQALGQKNNTFTIWVALTFINPLVALGPTCYVVYHNLYNSIQLYLFEKKRFGGAKAAAPGRSEASIAPGR